MKLKPISKCRICGSNLKNILSLGEQYLVSYTPKEGEPEPTIAKFPLELIRCDTQINPKGCGLVQLRHSVPPSMMYERYFYKSGVNKMMTENLKEIVDETKKMVTLKQNDIVVDIGCNDGTLLNNYQNLDIRAVGFDPAKNMAQFSRKTGAKIIVDFFNEKIFKENFDDEKAKIISSIAMFYDLEDPKIFVSDIAKILAEDGVWVLELSYLPSMLSQNAFDTIVHEHLEYYYLAVIEFLLDLFGLKIIDIFLNDVNGGSMRMFIKNNSQPITDDAKKRIQKIKDSEEKLGLRTEKPYAEFLKKCEEEKDKLMSFLKTESNKGKKIVAYGASTKGNTLLQYCKIDNNLIEFVADRNPDKWGRKTIGTNLKIISEEEARKQSPDYFLVLPWHFITEFVEREQDFLKRGGKFVVPLPRFKVILN